MPPDSFVVISDKLVSSDVTLAEWCPTMDLLALATSENHIWIYRFLAWLRLIVISGDGRAISAMVWHPDGKTLAVGYDNGTISLYSAENGELQSTTHSHTSKIVCLHWTQMPPSEKDEHNLHVDRTSDILLPVLPPANSSTNTVFEKTNPKNTNVTKAAATLDMLASGDESGVVCLHTFGKFYLGCISLYEHVGIAKHPIGSAIQKNKAFDIRKISLSPDLNILSVSVQVKTGMVLATFDTSTLAKRKNEISAVSLQASAITTLLEYFSVSLGEMRSKWSDGLSPFIAKLDVLKQMLKDAGSSSTIQADLFNLLVSGVGSPTIQQFLTNTLPEHPLRKLTKTLDSGCTGVQQTIMQTAKPCSENLLYRLSELHALSMWTENFAVVGLKETVVKEALDAAKQLALQTDLLLQTVSHTRSLYESLFLWLLKAQRKMSSEAPPARKEESRPIDELVVAKFLKKGITSDSIISMMGNLEENEDNNNNTNMNATPPTTTLANQYKKTQELTKFAFRDSPRTISLSFTLHTLMPVYYTQNDTNNCRCAVFSPKTESAPQYQYIALHCPDEEDLENTNYVIWILRFDHTPERPGHTWEAASISVESETGVPIDMAFYNNETIAVLREHEAEGQDKVLRFELYEYSALDFVPFNTSEVRTGVCKHLQDLLPQNVCEPIKLRTIQAQQGPYAMMVGPRGVGCVIQGRRRIQLFDLEEEEGQEEEEGEDAKEEENANDGEDDKKEKAESGDSDLEDDDVER